VLVLEALQELEPEALPAPLDQGALVVLEVPVPARDLEAQALDLAPAPVLAPTQALAVPALSEIGDQALDLRPRPLPGQEICWEPVWQEEFWEGQQGALEEAWQAGSNMLSNLTGTGQTNTSHSPNQRKALEAISLEAAKSRMVIRPPATGQAGVRTLPGVLANGSQRSRVCPRKCSGSV